MTEQDAKLLRAAYELVKNMRHVFAQQASPAWWRLGLIYCAFVACVQDSSTGEIRGVTPEMVARACGITLEQAGQIVGVIAAIDKEMGDIEEGGEAFYNDMLGIAGQA